MGSSLGIKGGDDRAVVRQFPREFHSSSHRELNRVKFWIIPPPAANSWKVNLRSSNLDYYNSLPETNRKSTRTVRHAN